jgi:hypothetical protein
MANPNLTFNEQLAKDFAEAIDGNNQVNVYIPGATLIGAPIEIDDYKLVIGISGGMRGGVTRHVIDIEAVNAYTINAQ